MDVRFVATLGYDLDYNPVQDTRSALAILQTGNTESYFNCVLFYQL
jgi:hypothetical protein